LRKARSTAVAAVGCRHRPVPWRRGAPLIRGARSARADLTGSRRASPPRRPSPVGNRWRPPVPPGPA